MSEIDGIGAPDWIRENHPENDLFKVYWKNIVGDHNGGVTFDPEEGEGLRYEWYYKDNKKDGISKSSSSLGLSPSTGSAKFNSSVSASSCSS